MLSCFLCEDYGKLLSTYTISFVQTVQELTLMLGRYSGIYDTMIQQQYIGPGQINENINIYFTDNDTFKQTNEK